MSSALREQARTLLGTRGRKALFAFGIPLCVLRGRMSGLRLFGDAWHTPPTGLRHRTYLYLFVEHGSAVTWTCLVYGLLVLLNWRHEITALASGRPLWRGTALRGCSACASC